MSENEDKANAAWRSAYNQGVSAGRNAELQRVLGLLQLCSPAQRLQSVSESIEVPAAILRAIAGGTPADRVTLDVSRPAPASTSEPADSAPGASKWAGITQRMNERQRAKAAAAGTSAEEQS